MTGFNYAALRDGTAYNLLTKFGQSMTLKKTTQGTYNKATGQASITSTDYSTVGVIFDYKKGQTTKEDNLIKETEKKIFISAKNLAAVPKTNDKITAGGVTWIILDVLTTLSPGGVVIMYELHVKGA